MTELPKGWVSSRLADVADVRLGRQRSPKNATGDRMRPYLRAANVKWAGLDLSDVNEMAFTAAESQTYELRPGDLLLGEASGSPSEVGKPGQYKGEIEGCCFQNTLLRVRLPEELLPDFYEHYFREQALNGRFAAGSRGVGIRHLGAAALSDWTIPVPPSAEQERIVTAIEEAFSKLDAGEAGLRAVRQLLKRMRDAILTAAVTGRLVPQDPTDTPAAKLLADLGLATAGDDEDTPESWARVRLGDIAHVGSGTTPRRGDASYWEDGSVPWVTSGLITNGVIREVREFVTERALQETSLRLWPMGTLLVAMYGEGQTRGRCAELGVEATCNQACAAISLLDPLRVYKDFLRLSFDANYAANRRLASGGVQPNLNAGLIKDMVLSLPPPEQQSRIVAEVDRQFSFVDACERAVDVGLARSAGLRRSVLKAAFEGRLVPQDPADESASVLLDRIRAERAAQPVAKRRARQTA
ncbi:MAG TPA: restriction endonuclease subunit S [Ilumatobacteraceae bacterium]|nr:restriction endonuclease subunit S [Ilumatobacteraceae bacterium]